MYLVTGRVRLDTTRRGPVGEGYAEDLCMKRDKQNLDTSRGRVCNKMG